MPREHAAAKQDTRHAEPVGVDVVGVEIDALLGAAEASQAGEQEIVVDEDVHDLLGAVELLERAVEHARRDGLRFELGEVGGGEREAGFLAGDEPQRADDDPGELAVSRREQEHGDIAREQRLADEVEDEREQGRRGQLDGEQIVDELPAALLGVLLHVRGGLLHQEAVRVVQDLVAEQHGALQLVQQRHRVLLHRQVAHVQHDDHLRPHRRLEELPPHRQQRALRLLRRVVAQVVHRLPRPLVAQEVHRREPRELELERVREVLLQKLVDPVLRQQADERPPHRVLLARVVLLEVHLARHSARSAYLRGQLRGLRRRESAA